MFLGISWGKRATRVRQRFGPWSLDVDTRRLERDGADVHLTPKAFDLLAFLIDQAPRVVPKSELHERLWPDSFVSDATLFSLVKEIRRACDTTNGPPLIRTAHRVGYAFAGLVEGPPPTELHPLHWLMRKRDKLSLVEGSNVIGRDANSAICLDVPGVSRRHARIVVDGTIATLDDLGSKNGTFCEGIPITKAVVLRNADRIHLASVELVYRSRASPNFVRTETQDRDAPAGGPTEPEV
jgi:DNA-binding winged helix-turn-helix (wHTH) protein